MQISGLWRNEEFCSWVDIQPSSSGIQGFVLQIEFFPNDAAATGAPGRVLLARAVNLPRLHCLGSHAAAPNTSSPGGDRVVFLMHGSYFAVRDADAPPERRHLFIGDGPDASRQAVGSAAALPVTQSYDASLLTRLLRMHRAIKSQGDTNEHFKDQLQRRGVTDAAHMQEDEAAIEAAAAAARPETSRSLRQQVFSQLPKRPATRLRELKLRAQIERLRLRNELYKNERERMSGELERTLQQIGDVRTQMNDANVVLTNKVHAMSKDKVTFSRWEERLAANASYVFALQDVLHSCQLNVLHGFHFLFPIQNAGDDGDNDSKTTTSIRWICMPRVEEARGRSNGEMALGVCSGWVAEMLVIFSSVLDVPVRYPIRLGGSNSSIADPAAAAAAVGGNVFPLYLKGADATRAEYGIFVMQKNLAQLRWACGLPSNNFKATLKNLYELIMLKDRRGTRYNSMDQLRLHYNPLSPPPGALTSDVSKCASKTQSTSRVSEFPQPASSTSPLSSISSTSSPTVVVPARSDTDTHGAAENNREQNGGTSAGEVTSNTSLESSPTRLISKFGGKAVQLNAPAVRATERSTNSGNVETASSFWGDVQSRTQALSVTTSFQRRKHVSNQH